MRGLGSICAKPCWCQWTLWFPGQTLRHADIRPSTARLSLIRMMDGAELWLQPSPAASWELRDTEGETEKWCEQNRPRGHLTRRRRTFEMENIYMESPQSSDSASLLSGGCQVHASDPL
ncbi:hypothetical protein OYC64_020458 [Pagothenia borchgrevinki]|uniref:Uncharacterized protein n=1 Tax=Pagothenia borchgrevinki TaxID=8213 RepID=A0ABD2FLT4_PAGBO